MTLGSYPSRRYNRSWITQRLTNRAPMWSQIRKFHSSIGQQLLNPIGIELENGYKELEKYKKNSFLSTCDLGLIDHLYLMSLTYGMEFQYTENSSGEITYIPPSVYATIDDVEYQITQAEYNNIETLAYDCLPSRIEDGETSYSYQEIIPETTIENLSTITPVDLPFSNHIYITLSNNTNWETRTNTRIYYSKLHITGITKKGTTTTEVLPLRYNGTFKTINQWSEITSISASYLSSDATIVVEIFPYNRDSYLDTFNINVSPDHEKMQFLKLNNLRSFGSTLISESFVIDDLEIARNINSFEKETNFEIELLDENEENINLVDFIQWPNSRFIYAIDSQYFYVYDINFPYPNGQDLDGESFSPLIDLYTDQWVVARDDTATIKTKDVGSSFVPLKVRWHVLDPNGNERYMGLDGSLWPITSTDGWIENIKWGDNLWDEQEINFSITLNGEWIVTLEAFYVNDDNKESETLYTKFLFFCPSITPEVQLELPATLQNSTKIGLSSNKEIWLLGYTGINLMNIYFDYFIVDYERGNVWLKENYSSVRITI